LNEPDEEDESYEEYKIEMNRLIRKENMGYIFNN